MKKSRILELNELLSNKEKSAAQIAAQYIAKAECKQENYKIITKAPAEISARAVDDRLGKGYELYVLEGAPYAILDSFQTRNIRSSAGSMHLTDYEPVFSATVYEKLRSLNALLIGKADMNEFGLATGEGREECILRLVNDEDVLFAIAADTSGFLLKNAARYDLVAFKPSFGMLSRFGLITVATSLDTPIILAKCAEDVSVVFDEINENDPMDPLSIRADRVKTHKLLCEDISGVRVSLVSEFMAVADEVATLRVQETVKALEARGCVVTELSLPSVRFENTTHDIIEISELSSNLLKFDGVLYGYKPQKYDSIDDLIKKSRSESFTYTMKKQSILGTHLLSAGHIDDYFKKALCVRNAIKNECYNVFSHTDILVTPVSSKQYNLTSISHTTGLPAAIAGGVQFMANYNEDHRLLNVVWEVTE